MFRRIRVYGGVPWAFERHWNRLARDADRVQIPLTHDPATVLEAVRKVIGANRGQAGCIRIYFVFNKGSPWASNERLPADDLLIYSTDLPVRVGPPDLGAMPTRRHPSSPLAVTKPTASP